MDTKILVSERIIDAKRLMKLPYLVVYTGRLGILPEALPVKI